MKKILAVDIYGNFDVPYTHTLLEYPTDNYDMKTLLSEFLEEEKERDKDKKYLTVAMAESNGISRIHYRADFTEYTNKLVEFLIRKGFTRIEADSIILSD